jgi:hypothetical protein
MSGRREDHMAVKEVCDAVTHKSCDSTSTEMTKTSEHAIADVNSEH